MRQSTIDRRNERALAKRLGIYFDGRRSALRDEEGDPADEPDPRDTGAYGDGIHDDTEAIRRAIEDMPSRGGTLRLRKKHLVTGNIAINKPVEVAGVGEDGAEIIVGGSDVTPFTLQAEGSSLTRLRFSPASGIAMSGGHYVVLEANDALVEHCRFTNFYRAIAFSASGAANDCLVRKCRFQTNVVLDNGYAIWERGTKNRIRDCWFTGVLSGVATAPGSYPHDAIKLGGGGTVSYGASVKDCLIEKFRHGVRPIVTGIEDACTIEDVRLVNMGHWAVLVDPESSQYVDALHLSRVTIKGTQGIVAGGSHGIYLRGSSGLGVRICVIRDCEVTGLTPPGSHGLYADGVGNHQLKIVGGRYAGNAGNGLYILQHDSSEVKVHAVRAHGNNGYGARFGPGVRYDLKDNEFGKGGSSAGANGLGPAYDDDTGLIGGRGKKRHKKSKGNSPDRANDDFDGLELMDDGSDNTATIQAMIDALPANGGTIRVPEGTFDYAGDINIWKRVIFEARGRNVSIFRSTGASNLFNVTADRVQFHKLGFRSTAVRTDRTILFQPGADHWRIEHCRFENEYRAVLNYGSHGTIENCDLETNMASEALLYINGYANTVRKCRLKQNNASKIGTGVYIGVDETVASGQNKVIDCSIDGFSIGYQARRSEDGSILGDTTFKNCIWGWRIDPSAGITNDGTKITNVSLVSMVNYGGIVERDGGGSILDLQISKGTVRGGGCSGAGYLINGSAGTIRNLTLRGCTVEGITGTGFSINAAISDWKVTDCVARSCGGWGLDIVAGNTDYSYSQNRFRNNGAGNLRDASAHRKRQGRANDPDDSNVTPHLSLWHDAAQPIMHSTSTWTSLLWNQEVSDIEGMHSTTSNTHQITIRTDGRYNFLLELEWEVFAFGSRYARLVRTRGGIDKTIMLMKVPANAVGETTEMKLSVKKKFQENDIIRIDVRQVGQAGNALDVLYSDEESPLLTVEKLD